MVGDDDGEPDGNEVGVDVGVDDVGGVDGASVKHSAE